MPDEGLLLNLDERAKQANELLSKKYENNLKDVKGNAGYSPAQGTAGPSYQSSTGPSWKEVAESNMQLAIQLRDEMHSWKEAYEKERERSDRMDHELLNILCKLDFIGFKENENPENETKHIVQPVDSVRQRRSNWPEFRAKMEKRFMSAHAHDAGIE